METTSNLRDDPYLLKLAAEATEREAAVRRQRQNRATGKERWYLTREGSRFSEAKADRLFEEYGCETYVPKVRKRLPVPLRELSQKQRRAGIKLRREKLVPIWQSYRLIRLDFRNATWREMFERTGIFGIIGVEENDRLQPKEVPDVVLEEFRKREQEGALPGGLSMRDLGFAIGEAVRVSSGHLSGYKAIVDRLPNIPVEDVDDDVRVRLAVLMFGRVTLVEIPLADIEKL